MKPFIIAFFLVFSGLAASAKDFYLTGGFNGWSPNQQAYKFTEKNGVYSLSLTSVSGELKITTSSWEEQFGCQTPIQYGVEYKAVQSDNGYNIRLPEDPATNVTITFDYNNKTLRFDKGEKFYLVGDFNDWLFLPNYEFTLQNGVYELRTKSFTGRFKIATESWEYQFGNGSEITLNDELNLQRDGNDMIFNGSFTNNGNIIITFNPASEKEKEEEDPDVDEPENPEPETPDVDEPENPEPETPDVDEPETPDVDEPENPEPETPDVDEPENPEPETPDVDDPENPEPETPDVDEPENPEPETPDVDEPENTEPETPDVDEPENTEPETPDVDEPENPEPETPDVDEPENPDPETPDVDEPENPEPETPDVDEPENPDPETPDVEEPENPEPETPDVDEPENPEPETPDVDEPENPEPETPDVDEPIQDAGVAGIMPDEEEPEYYDMQGHRVRHPAKGLYIRRHNGKTEKIMIR